MVGGSFGIQVMITLRWFGVSVQVRYSILKLGLILYVVFCFTVLAEVETVASK